MGKSPIWNPVGYSMKVRSVGLTVPLSRCALHGGNRREGHSCRGQKSQSAFQLSPSPVLSPETGPLTTLAVDFLGNANNLPPWVLHWKLGEFSGPKTSRTTWCQALDFSARKNSSISQSKKQKRLYYKERESEGEHAQSGGPKSCRVCMGLWFWKVVIIWGLNILVRCCE